MPPFGLWVCAVCFEFVGEDVCLVLCVGGVGVMTKLQAKKL